MTSHSYNTNKEGNGYFVHSKWKNYLKADDTWDAIDNEVVDTGSAFVMDKAPFKAVFPYLSTGTAVMTSNCRYDIWKKEKVTADPLDMSLEADDAVEVQGQLFDINNNGKFEAVIYPQAFPQWDADLIYHVEHGKAPRLKKIIQYNSDPGAHEAKFYQGYSSNIEISSRKIPDGLTRRQHRDNCHTRLNTPQPVGSDNGFYIRKEYEEQKRGIGIKECKIWDSAGKVAGITSDFRKHGQGFTLTKYIPAEFFEGAVYPVRTDAEYTIYPDANPETTSVDGHATSIANAIWASVRANAGGSHSDAGGFWWGGHARESGTVDQFDRLNRSIILFDTSAVEGAVILAKISAYCIVKLNNIASFTMDVGITSSSPASNTDIVNSDFAIANFGTTVYNTTAYAGIATASFNDFTLNANGRDNVNVGGISKFSFRNNYHDIENNTPASAGASDSSYVQFASAESANDPYLYIETGIAGAPSMLSLLGVGHA